MSTSIPTPQPPSSSPSADRPVDIDPGPSSAADPEGRDAAPRRSRARIVGITAAWWVHAAVRVLLALALLGYGASKLILMQFGVADVGDALIAQGEMSPMGLLWRMVAYSPVFQFLAGLAEVGAALALLWRRTVVLGALLGLADMAFVFVLNIGYDVPVKQLSLGLAVMSLVVLLPWVPRLARVLTGHGAIPAAPQPRLLPWRRADRIAGIVVPAAVGVLAIAVTVGTVVLFPKENTDDSLPTGVWSVSQDTAGPAAQLAQDERWQAIAFGQVDYHGSSRVQLRTANGQLHEGTYERQDATHVTLHLRELRHPGQSGMDFRESPTQDITLTLEPGADGTLHVTGKGVDLVLSPDADGRTLYDRGFSWTPRPDDPFNR